MAKCFITGVELPAHEAYVLDVAAANNSLRKLRQRLQALQRMILQFAPYDEVEVFNRMLRKNVKRRDKRLVTRAVADALSVTCPETILFVSFTAWKQKRLAYRNWKSFPDNTDGASRTSEFNNPGKIKKEGEQ